MLILLPPSETKRDGGLAGSRLSLSELSYPELTDSRSLLIGALEQLSADPATAAAALKLGPRQAGELERNLRLRSAPLLPALDRYDGVLYDALEAGSLTDAARDFAHGHLAISSALFGLTRALDPIPAYRLSADSRVPGIRLRAVWANTIATLLAQERGVILDLRSEAYAALGPLPGREDAVFLRVLSDQDGRRRALNHFNKAGKGRLVRELLLAGIDHPDIGSLLGWAQSQGIRLETGTPGELALIV